MLPPTIANRVPSEPKEAQASLEQLLEGGVLQAEILHPGSLEITKELAALCQIGSGLRVLDVASGSGEAACFIAETFQGTVVGVDGSEFMVERARRKAGQRKLNVEFQQSDAHNLPFADNTLHLMP
jgi:SAM-dependent methyltransferase